MTRSTIWFTKLRNMFIKPNEIKKLLYESGFEWREYVGSKPNVSIPTLLGYLRKRAKGEWTFGELGKKFWLVNSKDTNIFYGGYAVKKNNKA
jgi:2-polyprenyl-6-hydroxyphenyl methylase/3-demethylubiquinone-9 3-methyltransferase